MSLARMFKRIYMQEAGFFSEYYRSYRYKLIDPNDLSKHYDKLQKRFTHWSRENLEKYFPMKIDDLGRNCVYDFGQSMPCLLPEARDKFPTIKGLLLVPKVACLKCPHRKTLRRKPYCQLLRDKNKGLTKSVVDTAIKAVNDILK